MLYTLYERQRGGPAPRGLSCDEEGVFLAGEVALVTRRFDHAGRAIYKARSRPEIGWLLAKAYGSKLDISNQLEGLDRLAVYMSDGKWVLAKIAAVQLRFPELPDDQAVSA